MLLFLLCDQKDVEVFPFYHLGSERCEDRHPYLSI